MDKWEYTTCCVSDLNKNGLLGWECISVVYNNNMGYTQCYLKRKIIE